MKRLLILLFILFPLVAQAAKVTEFQNETSPDSSDLLWLTVDVSTTPADRKLTLGNLLLWIAANGSFGFTESGNYSPTGTWDWSGATLSSPMTISAVNAAGGSANALTLRGTLEEMDGSDLFRGIFLDYTNTGAGSHTATDALYGIYINSITGSDAFEAGLYIGNGWDYGIMSYSPILFAGNGTSTKGTLVMYDLGNSATVSITPADTTTSYKLTLPGAAVDGGWTTGLLGFGPDGTGIFVNIADLEATIPISGEITDEQVACWESSETPGTNKLKSCGAKTTDNSTATHLLCKDDSNEIENCTLSGLAITGTTSPTITVTSAPAIPSGTNPTVDAAGEIAIDTDGANVTGDMTLRVYDGAATVAIGRKLHDIHVTVVKPQDLADAVRDAFLFWSNETGMTFTITSIKCWAGTDDATLNVEETDADGQNNATVDAIECATNGTGVYTDAQTTITGATIEAGHLLWLDFDDTDDPSFVKITVSGWFNAAVD